MSEDRVLINDNLTELHSSGYEIADGEPDIRGWKVLSTENEIIGKVDELLFDTASLKVRYIIIDLNGKPLNLLSRDLIIPIGLAQLNTDDKMVLFPEVTVAHFASLPEYKKGKVSIDTERNIRSVFDPTKGITYNDTDFNDAGFYNDKYFDDSRMYKNPRAANNNNLVNEQPDDSVLRNQQPPAENKINDDYREKNSTGNKPIVEGSFAPFQEGAIEIKEHAEIPVVTKQARVVEEVSINKEVNEHNQKVKDTVRSTEVEIERLKDNDLLNK